MHVHMVKPLDEPNFQYRLLAVDVKGMFLTDYKRTISVLTLTRPPANNPRAVQ